MTASHTSQPSAATITRRGDILRAAAHLFADRGYRGVGVDEIGAAVGITGPGLYRHFRGKKDMLAKLLVGISEDLLAGGRRTVAEAPTPESALDGLIRWHIGFALDSPELITLHGRELTHLTPDDQKQVRRYQRQYVELWVEVVGETYPDRRVPQNPDDEPDALVRAAVHSVFGLINATPYSATAGHHQTHADGHPVPGRTGMEDLLHRMSHGAFSAI
jgi:AcrR family transcriptional regulator